ncbi:MAG: cytochrome P450 [Candidatus Eremiobacteraeota bacterium]|nr:cytochrome P450 [Candidatus Eremiobacteraeota bacterium]MCW5867745.1 cytochrome P450 [Candidatus Eremiobacteraeota bacterium]
MLIRDSFAPAPLRRPKRAPKKAQDSASLSAAAQLRQCPVGPQLSNRSRNLSRQNRALGETAATCLGGPAQAATAQIQAQMRQGLCPYLSQAAQNNPTQDWSALNLLRQSLEQGQTDPVDFLHGLHQNYGASVKVGDVLFESRPEVVSQILVATERPKNTQFGKSTLQKESLGQVYGEQAIFLEEGAAWKAQRKNLQPHFVGRSVLSEENHQHLQDLTDKHLDALPVGIPIDLNLKLRTLSLDVALSHMFGLNLELDELENLAGLFERGGKLAQNKLFGLKHQDPELPGQLNALADRLIASPTPAPTLQTLLADPQAQDKEWLRNQVLMLTMLGHETTANLLTYSAAELVNQPQQLAELRAEYQATIGTARPTVDQTTDLKVTRNLIKDTTREHAPNYLVSREALEDLNLDGMRISAGTQVLMSIQDINEQANGKIFSFGGGARVCMGQVLARLEAAVVLSQLMTRFDLEPTEKTSLAPKSDFSSRPADAHYTLHRTDIGQKQA